jgi:hypothetical protein
MKNPSTDNVRDQEDCESISIIVDSVPLCATKIPVLSCMSWDVAATGTNPGLGDAIEDWRGKEIGNKNRLCVKVS